MSLLHVYARQARQPSGWLGALIGLVLDRGNRRANESAIALLDVQRAEQVLELGFGPGRAVAALAEVTPHGRLCGVDFSDVMVRQARRRNAAAIRAGRVELRRGDVTALPFGPESFHKVLGVNLLYFLPDAAAALREWRRVLKPGGRLILFLAGRETRIAQRMIGSGLFTFYTPDELVRLAGQAGFPYARIEAKTLGIGPCFCLLAERQGRDEPMSEDATGHAP